MLQAHSFLWHYLWVAPNILLILLALLIWKRGLSRQFPVFVSFALLGALGELAVYTADVVPTITPQTFWLVDWASLLIEGPLKFLLVAEIFANVFGSYASLARLGRFLISGAGIVLVLTAAVAAAYTPKDGLFGIVAGAHLLEQTVYLVESGLLVSIFLLAAYFHLRWNRRVLGIALGLSFSACVHLATWAIMANGAASNSRSVLDFVNMATYHACVLMWFYYLLVPQKVSSPATAQALPDTNLDLWNRELERLLQQ